MRRFLPSLVCVLGISACGTVETLDWKIHIDAGIDEVRRGNYSLAISHLERARRASEQVGDQHPAVQLARKMGGEEPHIDTLWHLGVAFAAQGRYAEAEPLFLRALPMYEKARGTGNPLFAGSLIELGRVYMGQGRYAEAEPLFRRGLAVAEAVQGAGPRSAYALENVALSYMAQERYAEAEAYLRGTLAIEENIGPDRIRAADVRNNLGVLLERQGRRNEAEQLYLRAHKTYDVSPYASHPRHADLLKNLGRLAGSAGRAADAQAMLLRALGILEAAVGKEHPNVAATLTELAVVHRSQGRVDSALAAIRRANAIYTARYADASAESRRAMITEQRARSFGYEQHVGLLHLDSAARPAALQSNAAEAFAMAQLARASDTAQQVARMAARFASGNDVLADLVRQRQDLVGQAEAADGFLLAEMSKPAAQRNPGAEQRLRDQHASWRKQVSVLDERMRREFPQYAELANPRPLSIDAARELLRADEALVVFLVAEQESFVWVVRTAEARFERLPAGRRELAQLVRRVRAQLDLGGSDTAELFGKPFDVRASHELYKHLFSAVESSLAEARHLIVVADETLQSLPLGVLLTTPAAATPPSLGYLASLPAARNLAVAVATVAAPPAASATGATGPGYADLPWLIRRHAISVLPAVNSLRAFRAFSAAKPAAQPFAGFGDPVLSGGAGGARGTMLGTLFSRGAAVDVDEVRKMQRLPETADELRSIAATLNGHAGDVYLGAEATETRVKKLDLARFRNIAFATHGLMAGELQGVAEPSLVLTPPEKGSELDDGLLTAGEIAQLKLNADWVILSACNTAAPDGTPGAEGFSGLAKAFFYAGARSLLVSHWAVSSEASVGLTTRLFEETAKGAAKSEALRRSMLALMQRRDNPYFAHPAFWAPFVVVGEGASRSN